ncbi:hypothetical protein BsWGS_21914 [Bradybaena similaris]
MPLSLKVVDQSK